jgi:hypothetical protein
MTSPRPAASGPGTGPQHRAFKAFLSHSYRSPEVNLFFFGLFAKIAEVQFEADAPQGQDQRSQLGLPSSEHASSAHATSEHAPGHHDRPTRRSAYGPRKRHISGKC